MTKKEIKQRNYYLEEIKPLLKSVTTPEYFDDIWVPVVLQMNLVELIRLHFLMLEIYIITEKDSESQPIIYDFLINMLDTHFKRSQHEGRTKL